MAKGMADIGGRMQDFVGVAPLARVAEPLRDRILARVVVSAAGCWEWQGALSPTGYGRISVGSRKDLTNRIAYTHRVAYEEWVGPIPNGLVLDHLCRNPKCCNPEHLEPVTQRTNVVVRGRGPVAAQALQTECKRGHEFTPENTWTDKKGKRYCRACRKVRGS